MIPVPARYLLRFDDFCPTISREKWERFGGWIEQLGVRPILAVVPDNRDPGLRVAPGDAEFWAWMRALEARGAAIGLHGLTHVCASASGGLIPMHRETEFAGVAEERQREWIRAGVGKLRAEGLAPRVFVAPRHGFDRGTLRALAAEGLPAISDGFAERAFRRGGVTWIPQQIWEPVEKSRGLWTICVHSNTASDEFARALGRFVAEHRAQMSSLDEVLAEGDPGPLGPVEGARAWMRLTRVRLSKARKRWMGRK